MKKYIKEKIQNMIQYVEHYQLIDLLLFKDHLIITRLFRLCSLCLIYNSIESLLTNVTVFKTFSKNIYFYVIIFIIGILLICLSEINEQIEKKSSSVELGEIDTEEISFVRTMFLLAIFICFVIDTISFFTGPIPVEFKNYTISDTAISTSIFYLIIFALSAWYESSQQDKFNYI